MSKIDELERRVEAQEAEIVSLREQLDETRNRPSPVQQQPQPATLKEMDQPMIVEVLDRISSAMTPSDDELERLHEIVVSKYPTLRPEFRGRMADRDEQDYKNGFRLAFLWLANVGRVPDLNRKYYASWWNEACEQWGRRHQVFGTPVIGIAALAWGDVKVGWGTGASICFGLDPYAGIKPTKPTWRDVLEGRIKPQHIDLSAELRHDASSIIRVGY